ncbi:MAG: hypothetical protein NTW86_20665 [Candidatus Sumerlaeota bacterium]|nr:hypothetical protein [Candidatus Sumerlaeota bacterium]
MADLSKSGVEFLNQVSAQVKKDILGSIAPAMKRIQDAVKDLEAALSGGAAKAVRGRRGRKPGRRAAAAVAKAAPAGQRQRSPRGTLLKLLVAALKGSEKPMTLTNLRDTLLKNPLFRGRNPKNVYTQIVMGIKRIPGAVKTPDGYVLKNGGRKF